MIPVFGKHILLIGGGGGFDIVAVQMIREATLLEYPAICIDTAGLLNPKFDHYYSFDGFKNIVHFEEAVNKFITASDIRRFRRHRNDLDSPSHPGFDWYLRYGTVKPMVDTELRKSVNHQIWHFSTRFGIEPIVKFLSLYDSVILCDVGGDILYSGSCDNEVRTPLIDAFSLSLLTGLSLYRIISNSKVMLLGIGTDGELTASHMRTNLQRLSQKKGIEEIFTLKSNHLKLLHKYYNKLCYFNGGNTIRLMFAIWEATQLDKRVPVIAQRNVNEYEEWFNKVYILNSEILCQHNPLAMSRSFGEIIRKAYELGWRPKIY